MVRTFLNDCQILYCTRSYLQQTNLNTVKTQFHQSLNGTTQQIYTINILYNNIDIE